MKCCYRVPLNKHKKLFFSWAPSVWVSHKYNCKTYRVSPLYYLTTWIIRWRLVDSNCVIQRHWEVGTVLFFLLRPFFYTALHYSLLVVNKWLYKTVEKRSKKENKDARDKERRKLNLHLEQTTQSKLSIPFCSLGGHP